ncbi:MAG: lysophospholipid acyltransferase family protein [Paracoccaceae bacterium]|nr:lysophospholipid acyltransferase family protein [Paracoccaceae bacterium]MDE3240625.1 lysophospholipid acyltransferase family protein [Paracoccaceae bacterium]
MTQIADAHPSSARDPQEPIRFSYAHEGQPLFRRLLITAVERASGSMHLRRLYDDWVATSALENPFVAAIRLLQLRLEISGTPLSYLREEGGLLLVANHPFGIADGLTLGWLATQLREQVSILTHSRLCSIPEFRPYLLPVDFGETALARKTSAATRRAATDLLRAGGAVVIFPGGSVATSNRPFRRPAAELPWHPFVGRLALTPGTTVVPVYVHGQNSLTFQIASHLSYPLRVASLFYETRRRIGSDIRLTIGAQLHSTDLAELPREDVPSELRRSCITLGGADPAEEFRWPSYIRW